MKIEYDEAKNLANIAKHGVSFERVPDIDWSNAIILEDDRMDYGEVRNIGYAMLENRLHTLIWTMRGNVVRPISLRIANRRERKDYEIEKNS